MSTQQAAPERRVDAPLTFLAWDSEQFGFPVGAILQPQLDDAQLEAVLAQASAAGLSLVYWQATHDRAVGAGILERYEGQRVDRRVAYVRQLDRADAGPTRGESSAREGVQVRIEEYPVGPPSSRLVELAMEAGRYSRFRRDVRFPAALFEKLYRTWIERSTRREIADTVQVAIGTSGEAVGMITASRLGTAGRIGLFGVAGAWQRAGIGTRLLASAHAWMRRWSAAHARVVTQAANASACFAYERNGYRIEETTNYYHFWLPPSAAAP